MFVTFEILEDLAYIIEEYLKGEDEDIEIIPVSISEFEDLINRKVIFPLVNITTNIHVCIVFIIFRFLCFKDNLYFLTHF